MFKRLTLKAKLLAIFFCIGLIPFFVLGGLTVFKVTDDYTLQVYRQLESLREIKKKQCEGLFNIYFKDISILAQTDFVINALKSLSGIVKSDKLRTDSEFYKAMAKNYSASIDYFANTSGYLDLLLIAANGDVVYTTAKQSELGANLSTGPLKTSPLGKCFDKSLKKKSLVDFESYIASNNEPAAFIGAPIMKKEKLLGCVILRIAVASINEFMQQREGMGETGETYLVGSDYLMRSDSPHNSEYHSVLASFANPETGNVKTLSARKALSGEAGQIISKNYNGKTVLSSFAPLNIGELTWAIIAEIHETEAFGAVNTLKWLLGIAGGLGVLSILVVALLTTRSITLPIKQIIQSLNQSAENVSSASGEISCGSQQLADGTGNQVASLEETSSSLEEMSSITKQNADHATEADGLMKKANTMVGAAYGSLDKLTTSMKAISDAGEETSKIIKTIDEIAFQTNLLALNAAVEAARAGEAGAGFAVVADEVRNLAIRAAEAAKETAGLIEGTIQKVNEGTSLVDHANNAFGQVVERTSKVGDLVGEIAGASKEQAQGILEINVAVSEMDQVTQQNATTAGESFSASESMSVQAKALKTMVDKLMAIVEGGKNSMESERAKSNRGKQKFRKHRSNHFSSEKAFDLADRHEVSPLNV